ncbi:unnamed protein product [Closterium sp. NIES-53]
MATPRVLRFDAEGRLLEFSVWLLRARRLLESQVQAHETLWAHASGDLPEPADPAPLAADPTLAESDRYARERAGVTAWKSRDAAACIALSSLLPESEETHFTQVRTASEFLTAIKARYATPTTVSLGRMFLPFLFPDLASFERTADLITHLCLLDSSYRAAYTDAQLALLPPPMVITIYFIATSLPDRLASIRDALLLKRPSELTIEVLELALKDVESNLRSVASASGIVPPPLFHGCTVPQLPTFTASLATAATDVTAAAITTSSRSRGRSGWRGGQGAGRGGGGGGGDVASGGGGSAGAGGATCAAAGDSPAASGGGDARVPIAAAVAAASPPLAAATAAAAAAAGFRAGVKTASAATRCHGFVASCSCRSLAHPTVLWHHRMGHPSISRMRAMSSQRLVLGLPRVLLSLPPSLAPPCGPCVEGRLRATPHSSLRPATKPFKTLHLNVWGPASCLGPERESFFLVVVVDYSRYTIVFPLAKKSDMTSTLIRRLLTTADTRGCRVSCLHSDRGGGFRSGVLAGFCREQGIRQSWTLPESPQQNGVVERRIGLVMEIAHTSMTHARTPHFLWPYAVRYAAHPLNLWPRVSRPEVSPTSLWTGSPGAASHFRVWGCLALVRDTSADEISPRAVPCVFPCFPEDSSDYHPPLHRFFYSHDVRFDEFVPNYVSYPCRGLAPPPCGLAPSGVSHATPPPSVAPQVQPPSPQSSSQPTADPAGANFRGEDPGGASSRGDSSLWGAGVSGVDPGGATTGARGERVGAAVAGATAAGGAAAAAAAAAGAQAAIAARAAAPAAARGAAVAATAGAAAAATSSFCFWSLDPRSPLSFSSLPPLSSCLCPSRLSPSVLPSPPELALTASLSTPVTDYYRTYRPVLSCVLASLVADPRASLSSVSALTAAVTEFASTHCLDYATSLVATPPTSPQAVGGESALGCDALEDRQFELEFLATASPHLRTMLPTPEGEPDALDIPTPRTYAEAVSGPWASQWVKRPPGSPPVFKARYVARGFSQHEGVDSFQTTLRVLLHVAAQRDYELHSLDFSTTFLQGSLHEEVWLCRPSAFTSTFPPGTQWRLRRPVYGLRQAPRGWHDTFRSTLSDLGFQPSFADPSLFVRCGSTPFFVLVYVLQRFELQHSIVQRTPLDVDYRLTGPFPDDPFEPSGPYTKLVGCLMYLMTCTRPDLAFPLSILARFDAPGRHRPVHWTAVVGVAKYVATVRMCTVLIGS